MNHGLRGRARMSEPLILRIYRSGASRTLNVTKLLPKDWRIVLATKVEEGDNYVVVKFRVLSAGEEE